MGQPQNRTLTLDLKYDNTVIYIDHLTLTTGMLEIKDDKKVTFVVNDSINIKEVLVLNGKKSGPSLANQLTLIYLPTTKFVFSEWGGAVVNANIIIKQADISANTTQINGVILTNGKNVSLSGGKSNSNLFLIAPKAKVNVTGSYTINGSVIANEFYLSGGDASLIYNPHIDTSGFPGISGGATSTPTLEDLLQSGPILEQ